MKKFLFIICFITISSSLYSQKFISNSKKESESKAVNEEEQFELNSTNADYTRVLTGKSICEPLKLSTSSVLVTDARKLVSVKDDGTILWEKLIRNASDAKLYKLSNDFIILITRGSTVLTVYNQSGVQIFQRNFSTKIIGDPLEGFDSRFFVPMEDRIVCLTIGGKQKWEIANSYGSKNLYNLNDGSILYYKNIDSSTSRIKRINPFGETIEEFNYPKKILKAYQTDKGLFLTFQDEIPVFLYLDESNGIVTEKWKLFENTNEENKSNLKNVMFEKSDIISLNKNYFIYYYQQDKKIFFTYVDYDKGNLQKSFYIDMDDTFQSYKMSCNSNGIFAINSKTASFYDNFGRIVWKKSVSADPMEKPLYHLFSSDNTLLLFTENWSINYYNVHKTTGTKSIPQFEFSTIPAELSYKNFYRRQIFGTEIFEESMIPMVQEELKAQNYGAKEKDYTIDLLYYIDEYLSDTNSENFGIQDTYQEYEKNIGLTSKLILLSFSFENTEFTKRILSILETEKNKSLIVAALTGITQFGYDPDFKLINQIEIISKMIPAKDEVVISHILDATYSICAFMGKPAFEQYGNLIIKNFLSSRFSEKTRKKARDTYVRISKIFQN